MCLSVIVIAVSCILIKCNFFRFYATQSASEQDVLHSYQSTINTNLHRELFHIETLMKRNQLITQTSIKKLRDEVNKLASSKLKIFFFVICISIIKNLKNNC